MEKFCYFLITFLAWWIILHFLKKASGVFSFNKFNFYLYLFLLPVTIMVSLGSFLIVEGIDFKHHALNFINYHQRVLVWYIVIFTLIEFSCLTYVFNLLFFHGKIKEYVIRYYSRPIQPVFGNRDNMVFLILLILSCISFVSVSYVYIKMYPNVPLLALIKGAPPLELLRLRVLVSKEFGKDYIYRFGGVVLTPILAYVFYAYRCFHPYKKFLNILFYFFFFLSLMILSYDLKKAWAINFLLGFIMLKGMIYNGIPRKKIYIFFIFLVVLIFSEIIITVIGSKDISLATNYFAKRLFISQIAPLYSYFEIFPKQYSYLYGSDFPAWMHKFLNTGLKHISSAQLIKYIWDPQRFEANLSQYANTYYIGSAYANFGWLGVILMPIIYATIFSLFYWLFINLPKNPINLALFSYWSIYFVNCFIGTFVNLLWNAAILITIILYLYFYLIFKLLKICIGNNL